MKNKILVIDDEADLRETLSTILKKGYLPSTASSGQEALNILSRESFSAVFLDLRMPQMDGIETLSKIKEKDPDLPVIMLTASKDLKSAVECIKLGAEDYISKPFDVEELLELLKKAIEKRALKLENYYLKDSLSKEFKNFIGNSLQIRSIKELIKSISQTDSTVLITGESGTGKEVVARTIHESSNRKNNPFVAINCAAIPDNLLESELFGHERGSFTGAMERKIGKFEFADTGTIFLDEIGCMSMNMQSKLLRIIEEKAFERLGGNTKVEVDIRIIAATNIDFEKAIKEGTFREDLYYRLNVIPVKIPPLRERSEDIPLFIDFFLKKFNKEFNKKVKSVSQNLLNKLKNYTFPGNIRELQNIIERGVALSNGEKITEDILFFKETAHSKSDKLECGLKEACDNLEKEMIIKALAQSGFNQSKAAEILKIPRTTLSSKITSLEIKEKA